MRLIGYIKAFKQNCFAIPIYSDGSLLYYHVLDSQFKISAFSIAIIDDNMLNRLFLSKIFDINSIGAVIFIGFDNYILSNSADEVIEELICYLNEMTQVNEYNNIKNEALELKNIINGNENIENFLIDDEIFNNNKEIIYSFFNNYISQNEFVFKKILLNSNIREDFSNYLLRKFYLIDSNKLSIEEVLFLRTEERKRKFKEFNYKFDDSNVIVNYYDNFNKIPINSHNVKFISDLLFKKDENLIKKLEEIKQKESEKI